MFASRSYIAGFFSTVFFLRLFMFFFRLVILVGILSKLALRFRFLYTELDYVYLTQKLVIIHLFSPPPFILMHLFRSVCQTRTLSSISIYLHDYNSLSMTGK